MLHCISLYRYSLTAQGKEAISSFPQGLSDKYQIRIVISFCSTDHVLHILPRPVPLAGLERPHVHVAVAGVLGRQHRGGLGVGEARGLALAHRECWRDVDKHWCFFF